VLNVVLVAPEIAGNTGAIIRLCANTGAALHLVEPLGFSLEDRYLRRAGLDYHDLATVTIHPSFTACLTSFPAGARVFATSRRGTVRYTSVAFEPGDVIVFGAESAGLSEADLERVPESHRLTIPMRPGNRSLNLANAAAVIVYEAWRQHEFAQSGVTPAPS
jgi:tRNA (cytidine/uridine-2'-O-)-methyltransferase